MARSEYCPTANRTSPFLSLKPKLVLSVALVSAAVLAATAVAAGPHLAGYLGVFWLSIVASSWLFVPSGRIAILVAAAFVLNPLAVAIVGSAGGSIGELVGYILGYTSRKVIKKDKLPAWVLNSAQRHMALTVLVTSIVPNPFVDAIGIVAGRLRYPVWKFLACAFIGKSVQSVVLVHLALWNIPIISSWLGLG